MYIFLTTIYSFSTIEEVENNLCKIAEFHLNLLKDVDNSYQVYGFITTLFSSFFIKAFCSILLCTGLAFFGIHFERIPASFFFGVFIYSAISRFQYLLNFLQKILPIHTLFNIIMYACMIISTVVCLFYGLLKPLILLSIVYLPFDFLNDKMMDLVEDSAFYIVTKIFLYIILFFILFITYRFYKWLKGSYETFLTAVFAIYGSFLLEVTSSQLFSFPAGFEHFLKSILNSGLFYTMDFDLFTILWIILSSGTFIFQMQFVNEDYFNDRKQQR
ncbi:hypothetical protein NUSPORA_00495 [Nucleospora cyclopteri]